MSRLFAFLGLIGLAVPAVAADSLKDHDRWVVSVSVSDGLLASGGGQSLQYRPGDVNLWDLATGEKKGTLEGHETNVWSVALSPDAKTLVSTGYDGTIIVWDVATLKAKATLSKKGWCRSVAFAPDGSQFATAHEDGGVTLWSLDGKEVKAIKAHESQVFQVAFSADGSQLATASADKTAKVFNLADDKEVAKLEGHQDAVWTVAFGKDGHIATGGADRQVILWKDGKEKAKMKHKDWVSQLAFSPAGDAIAAADQGRFIKVWDVATGQEAASIGPLGGTQWTLAFAADGNQLVTGGRKDCLAVWDISARKVYDVKNHFPKEEPKKEEPKKEEPKKEEPKKEEPKKEEPKKEEPKKEEPKK
ncbi:MAG: WD40 repeat domain-containing protein [Planctomycetales bacterium]|nr:WD40 repeat domain-containing protein [Planctomycetales bacterium]